MAAVPLRADRARQRLIEAHLPLAHDVAGRFAQAGETREDLEQVGALALVRAIDRRDPARPSTLHAYVARCVEGEVRRHLRDRAAVVRVPRRVQAEEAQARRAAAGPDVRAATARRPLELQESDPAPDAVDLDELALARTLVSRASRALAPREREIVLLRFFYDCTQAEVAAALQISQSQVSRLLASAMVKMRRRLEVEQTSSYAR
ncbi:MAG TPA: sigma-70 family RNA polymerase sigma factor [Gaiellaceae bacterium]